MKQQLIILFLISPILYPSVVLSYNVTDFGPETYNPNTAAMDNTLGITGYKVEDFEDSVLLPKLQVSTDTQPTPMSTIENIPDNIGARPWDGNFSINNTNLVPGTGEPTAMSITFHIAGGAKSFGFGLSNVQSGFSPTHSILVNGNVVISDLFGELPSLYDAPVPATSNDPFQRTGYIRIDSGANEIINSVTFKIDSAPTGTIDGVSIDHLAFAPVPEPLSVIGTATALGFGVLFKKKKLSSKAQ